MEDTVGDEFGGTFDGELDVLVPELAAWILVCFLSLASP